MNIHLRSLLSAVMLCMFFVSGTLCQDDIQRMEENLAQLNLTLADKDIEIRDLNSKIDVLEGGLNQLKDDVAGLVSFTRNLVPIGAIIKYPGNDVLPANWLECDGRAVSRVEYAELFLKIGITYGGGDGIHHFNLPDRRGYVAVGIGSDSTTGGRVTDATAPQIALGRTFGEERHQLTENELPTHQHDIPLFDGTNFDRENPDHRNESYNYTPTLDYHFKSRYRNAEGHIVYHTQKTEEPFRPNASHTNMQPSIFMKFYIRAR